MMPDVVVGTYSRGGLCTDPVDCLDTTRVKPSVASPTIADLLLSTGNSFAIYADGYAEAYASAMVPQCPSAPIECPYNNCVAHPIACNGCLYDPSDIPFLYYQGFADTPVTGGLAPTPYEKDYSALQDDVSTGQLPAFAFVKARLFHNEHPNMSTIADGVTFVQDTVETILQSADLRKQHVDSPHVGRGLGGLAVAVSIDASALLHDCAQVPRNEFVLTVAVQLALALLSRRRGEDQLEEALTHLLDSRRAVDDLAAVDIDVFFLAFPQRRVGRRASAMATARIRTPSRGRW